MKLLLSLFAICSMLTFSCRASDTSTLPKGSMSCPTEISQGVTIPKGAILLGELPKSKRKLQTVGLVKQSTSDLEAQSWDEEMIEWEDGPKESISLNDFDSTQTDWMLKCSYPGSVDPIKKEYFEISVLLPLPERVPMSCRFVKRTGSLTATCKVNRPFPKTQLNPAAKEK